ncbi:hypothetical protein [Bacillus halotolerans]|uniref:hypothetical protein n=1 Tax=Bacillus halotolerans TaxID=260554 RepID=UPI00192B6B48|nr:hypothetical protein [Bacillus halotolerans]MBL4963934.1 hypothetical protein [Bacillus halotolerans]
MDYEILLLLQLIKKNGNIENLTKQGYQYSQIALMVNTIVENEYVEFSTGGMVLTEIGEEALVEYNKKLNRKYSEALISPQKEYILAESKSIYDIYLPNNVKVLK